MSKTTIVWLITYCSGIIAAVFAPVYGTYTYLFEYYFRPGIRWWGAPLPDLRWNYIVSVVLLISYLVHRSRLEETGPLRATTAKWLLGLAAIMLVITPTFAISPDRSWQQMSDFLKFIFFQAMIIATIRTEKQFDIFIALHIFGAGWWGWDVYQNPRRAAGRLVSAGSSDTLNDNFAAAHLQIVIPFIIAYLITHKDKRLRTLAAIAAPFVINMFILCNSRGATLGIIGSAFVALALAKRRHRIRMAGIGVAVALLFYVLADKEYIERQQTTTNLSDSGAQGRFAIWTQGMRMVHDYPFGTGGDGFSILSPAYLPDGLARNANSRTAHNTFLLVTVEWSLLGLVLLVGYWGAVVRLLYQVRKRAKGGDIWYYRSVALQASMVGLLISSTFSNRLYAEAPYWLGGLAVALHRIHSKHLADTEGAIVQQSPVPVLVPVWQRAVGTATAVARVGGIQTRRAATPGREPA